MSEIILLPKILQTPLAFFIPALLSEVKSVRWDICDNVYVCMVCVCVCVHMHAYTFVEHVPMLDKENSLSQCHRLPNTTTTKP